MCQRTTKIHIAYHCRVIPKEFNRPGGDINTGHNEFPEFPTKASQAVGGSAGIPVTDTGNSNEDNYLNRGSLPPTPLEVSDDDDAPAYEIERFIDVFRKNKKGPFLAKIKWRGYPESEATVRQISELKQEMLPHLVDNLIRECEDRKAQQQCALDQEKDTEQ